MIYKPCCTDPLSLVWFGHPDSGSSFAPCNPLWDWGMSLTRLLCQDLWQVLLPSTPAQKDYGPHPPGTTRLHKGCLDETWTDRQPLPNKSSRKVLKRKRVSKCNGDLPCREILYFHLCKIISNIFTASGFYVTILEVFLTKMIFLNSSIVFLSTFIFLIDI